MKPFALDSSHTNMSGVFYPTGHIFALFPTADLARRAADALDTAGEIGESAYASPEVIQKDIVRTLGTSDAVLPSVGLKAMMKPSFVVLSQMCCWVSLTIMLPLAGLSPVL